MSETLISTSKLELIRENSRVLQARILRLEAALISYRTALWSVSGPEAALLCRQLDEKFFELIYQIGSPQKQQTPKGKPHGKKH